MPISEGKVPVVPRPKRARLTEPEERPLMLMPVAEVIRLEKRLVPEPEQKGAVAELQHEAALSKAAEMSRLEAWNIPNLRPKLLRSK